MAFVLKRSAQFCFAPLASTGPLHAVTLAICVHIATLVTMLCAHKIGSGKRTQGRARRQYPQARGSSRLDTPAPERQFLIATHPRTGSPVNHRKQRVAACSNPYTWPGVAKPNFGPLFDRLCASVSLWPPALTGLAQVT